MQDIDVMKESQLITETITLIVSLYIGLCLSEEVIYVTPRPSSPCPAQAKLCLSLNQVALNSSSISSSTTLTFLAGDHLLSYELSVFNISNLRMLADSYHEGSYVIVCRHNASFSIDVANNVKITGLKFLGCGNNIFVSVKLLFIDNSTFQGQNHSGTALILNKTSLMITNSAFVHNSVGSPNFRDNRVGGVVLANNCEEVVIINSRFERNCAKIGGVLFATSSGNITITGSTFVHNKVHPNSQFQCVSDYASHDTVIAMELKDAEHQGECLGGAGGVLALFQSYVVINSSTFDNNTSICGYAGVMLVQDNSFVKIHNSEFFNNHAKLFGGILMADYSYVRFDHSVVYNTRSQLGGFMHGSNKTYALIFNSIFGNNTVITGSTKPLFGGVISVDFNSQLIVHSSHFMNNKAKSGGVLMAVNCNVTIKDCRLVRNQAMLYGGALYIFQSELTIQDIYFSDNIADFGGAIYAIEATVETFNETNVTTNVARRSGGGLYLHHSKLNCHHGSMFYITGNRAEYVGGGIHASHSFVTIYHDTNSLEKSSTHFISNVAQKGGGIYLESASYLRVEKIGVKYINKPIVMHFNSNSAEQGEAIHVNDETYFDVCSIDNETDVKTECFIQVLSPHATSNHEYYLPSIGFAQNNSTGFTVFGGLLDRCTLDPRAEINVKYKPHRVLINGVTYLKIISNINSTNRIGSAPLALCLCTPDNQKNCSYEAHTIKVQKGETFNVSLVAVNQVNHTLNNVMVYSSLRYPESGLGNGQLTQKTGNDGVCTNLSFSISSPHMHEELFLYPEGPCKNVTKSQKKFNISFLPCSCSKIGFMPEKSSNTSIYCNCICDPSLHPFISSCEYQSGRLNRSGNPWVAYVTHDVNPKGYIIYRFCPLEYCIPNVPVNLNEANGSDDAQCAEHRSGLLCGVCQPGLSLSLGSSHCLKCPKAWYRRSLAVLAFSLLAGIALVTMLMLLNLTVAVGTLNGIIFYANVIGANGGTMIPSHPKHFSTFISWLNLEVGFDMCYVEGMDTYWKTWLQLAFPSYVILLVVMVIFIGKHSMKFSRLIAKRNPVATLATLILISYTMFLRTTIAALSFAELNYPDGSSRWLWLPDASLEYFSWKHTALFIVAIIILLIGTAYTSLLFFWQWLLRHQNKTILKWVGSQTLYQFIEPYHAPYKFQHRYWTGLLLFARVALYLVFAVNASGDPGINLMAVSILVGALLFLRTRTSGLYKNNIFDWLEMTCHLNAGLYSVIQLYLLISGTEYIVSIATYLTEIITLLLLVAVIAYHMWSNCFSVCVMNYCKAICIRRHGGDNEAPVCCPPRANDPITPTFTVLEGISRKPQIHSKMDKQDVGHSSALHSTSDSDSDNISVASIDSRVPLLDGNDV